MLQLLIVLPIDIVLIRLTLYFIRIKIDSQSERDLDEGNKNKCGLNYGILMALIFPTIIVINMILNLIVLPI